MSEKEPYWGTGRLIQAMQDAGDTRNYSALNMLINRAIKSGELQDSYKAGEGAWIIPARVAKEWMEGRLKHDSDQESEGLGVFVSSVPVRGTDAGTGSGHAGPGAEGDGSTERAGPLDGLDDAGD